LYEDKIANVCREYGSETDGEKRANKRDSNWSLEIFP
jgi:hypothetical protein